MGVQKLLITITFFSFSITFFQAQTKTQRIDSLVRYMYDNNMFSGTVLVAEKDSIIYQKAYGWANYETKDTLKLNTPMPIASITKPFTATAILMLIEQGKLKLDDPVSKYLPEITGTNATIKQLLSHTSGIYDFNYHRKPWRYIKKDTNRVYGIKVISKDWVLSYYAKKKTKHHNLPEKYEYSNGGYTMLATIIERVSGMTYREYIASEIFVPLEMKNSFVLHPETAKNKKIGLSYRLFPIFGMKRVEHHYSPDKWKSMEPDGDKHIYSTVQDLFKYEKGLREGKLINDSTFEMMLTPTKLNNDSISDYSLGWVSYPIPYNLYYHTGSVEKYGALLERKEDKEVTIVFVRNMENKHFWDLWGRVRNIMNDKPIEPIEKTLIEKLTSSKFKRKIFINYTN